MVILALDTTAPAGSAAVLRDGDVLAERAQPAGVPHGTRLPGALLEALADARVTLAEVDLYAVASGPGAFTGLRIGIATMQGLAFAFGRPIAGVSALEALAASAWAAYSDVRFVGAWMDAARGEIFSALYDTVDRTLTLADPPAVGAAEVTLERWRGIIGSQGILLAGDPTRASLREAAVVLGDRTALAGPPPPLASYIGRLGAARAAAGEAGPPHALRPLYVRRPDAELARERASGESVPRG